MNTHTQRCRRCRTSRTHLVAGPGKRPGTVLLRCSACDVLHERGLSHAAHGARTRCGLALGPSVFVSPDAHVSCQDCAALLRVYLPVELPRQRSHCEACAGITENRQYLFIDLDGQEARLGRCGCGRERREAPAVHQVAERATACGLPLEAGVRALSADPVAVSCEACWAARECAPPEPLEEEQARTCSRCRDKRPTLKRVILQGQREVLERTCPGCGFKGYPTVLHHLQGAPGQTRCGFSTSHRYVSDRLPYATCRACVLAALAVVAGAPDWRPEVPIAEDYFAV